MSTKKMYAAFAETFKMCRVFSSEKEAIDYATELSRVHPGRNIHVTETVSIAKVPFPATSWTKV